MDTGRGGDVRRDLADPKGPWFHPGGVVKRNQSGGPQGAGGHDVAEKGRKTIAVNKCMSKN